MNYDLIVRQKMKCVAAYSCRHFAKQKLWSESTVAKLRSKRVSSKIAKRKYLQLQVRVSSKIANRKCLQLQVSVTSKNCEAKVLICSSWYFAKQKIVKRKYLQLQIFYEKDDTCNTMLLKHFIMWYRTF